MSGTTDLTVMRIIPRRCAWAAALVNGNAAFMSIGVFNNSAGADMLAVWAANVPNSSNQLASLGLVRGPLTNFIQNGIPVVPGSVGIPGALYSQDLAALPPQMFIFGFGASNALALMPPFPIAILNPGDTLALSNNSAAAGLGASFAWQAVHPEDIAGARCPICDGATEHTQPNKR